MNCFTHSTTPAVGICAVCGKAICRDCVAIETPRLVCRSCARRGPILGFEYRSSATIGDWPLVHICLGVDPLTMRPRVARGLIAIGNIAVGGVAIGGLAAGLITLAGVSFGVLGALGGVALGTGLSVGGVAVGSTAVGGVALGFKAAIGGAAFGRAVMDGHGRCDDAARQLFVRWMGERSLPPGCR